MCRPKGLHFLGLHTKDNDNGHKAFLAAQGWCQQLDYQLQYEALQMGR